ncbi:hypothetical protein NA56DRAFT_644800 [Hyaloscypha hepaticicola]|uniref:BHLH domain-containing protein n=1 Tax=Hyaloscypha hepaticicola TaxID=2082293 RepID=A0A2J6Q8M1_9HELO|nr:hypothetical protein NA56DRAFT_644800 [Hyaloscypha hepaticicola]
MTSTRSPVEEDTKSFIDFKNMASQEWDIQWQGTFGLETPVEDRKLKTSSTTYVSGNWYTNIERESTGEDMVDPYFCSSNHFLFDDPFIPLGDHSLSWQFPPTATMGFNAPSLQDAGNDVHGKRPTLEKEAYPSLQDTLTPDLPVEFKDTSKTSRPVGSDPSRSNKRKYKKRQPSGPRANSQRRDSHNAIEKKYRTSINEKIDRLRQAIPPPVRKNGEFKYSEEDDGSSTEKESKSLGLKDGKGAVLVRALGYIKRLEADATKLCGEAVVLESRLKAFQDLYIDGTVPLDNVALHPAASAVNNEPSTVYRKVLAFGRE